MHREPPVPLLTGEQLLELQHLLRSVSIPERVRRRAFVIWSVAGGIAVRGACRPVDLRHTRAQFWIRRFVEAGVFGLLDRPRAGRPRSYGHSLTREILKIVAARPRDVGLNFSRWSLLRLVDYIRSRPGFSRISRSTIRRRLLEAGIRLQ